VPHMLAQEHLGIVNALQYGSTRNAATLAAALAAIGSNFARLLLAFDGDGIWTFNSSWTIPANVTLELPPGVYVGGTGSGTINGPLVAYTPGWYVGSGTITLPQTSATYFNNLVTKSLGVNITPPLAQIHVSGDGSWPASIMIEERNAASGGATLSWKTANTIRGFLGVQNGNPDIFLNMQGGVRFIIAGPGANKVGIGQTAPTHLLELGLDDGYKPGGGSWGNTTSDARLKENVSVFEDGLAIALQLTPKWYEYNGLGGTSHDGKRYVGFIAQDIVALLPYMVGHDTTRKLYPDDADTTDFYTLSESALPYLLLNAIKEQQALIDALTARVAALEAP
jgi:hypothetical protein